MRTRRGVGRAGALATGILAAIAATKAPAWAQGPAAPAIQSTPLPALSAPQAQPVPAPAPPSAAPAPAKNVWLARPLAKIQILNKVDATVTNLSIPVGKTEKFATLTLSVEACVVRPPDQAPDAAAYLVIVDANASLPKFRGWLLAAEPAVAMFQHPIYDVRVRGCADAGVVPTHR